LSKQLLLATKSCSSLGSYDVRSWSHAAGEVLAIHG